VSDQGLRFLAQHVSHLVALKARVRSDEGIEHLEWLLVRYLSLTFRRPGLGDKALRSLQAMPRLSDLNIFESKKNQKARERIWKALPDCVIRWDYKDFGGNDYLNARSYNQAQAAKDQTPNN